ncbi:hypothetical protein PQD13_gp14 [Gordonia phage Clawz]|uniref:Uncharacterized protein n=1 Tax=Gordonia phage Clawz TaxID=2743910 RepID=A0AAE7F894_9CAUD|nr:hypothetical protein PQD13_gp14 [Gordonia phage Clawz]QKY79926.1 hypothetical protein SEA_CLAWZ_14 [Gordonia phage Clawz]
MMWNVQTVVEREVRAESAEEAIAIAESLVLAMPHLNTRVCPTEPDVYSQADELEETGASLAAERRRQQREVAAGWPVPENMKEWLSQFAGLPYVAPGYNAPPSAADTAQLEVVDTDEPHPDLVDLPDLTDKAALHEEDVTDE